MTNGNSKITVVEIVLARPGTTVGPAETSPVYQRPSLGLVAVPSGLHGRVIRALHRLLGGLPENERPHLSFPDFENSQLGSRVHIVPAKPDGADELLMKVEASAVAKELGVASIRKVATIESPYIFLRDQGFATAIRRAKANGKTFSYTKDPNCAHITVESSSTGRAFSLLIARLPKELAEAAGRLAPRAAWHVNSHLLFTKSSVIPYVATRPETANTNASKGGAA